MPFTISDRTAALGCKYNRKQNGPTFWSFFGGGGEKKKKEKVRSKLHARSRCDDDDKSPVDATLGYFRPW